MAQAAAGAHGGSLRKPVRGGGKRVKIVDAPQLSPNELGTLDVDEGGSKAVSAMGDSAAGGASPLTVAKLVARGVGILKGTAAAASSTGGADGSPRRGGRGSGALNVTVEGSPLTRSSSGGGGGITAFETIGIDPATQQMHHGGASSMLNEKLIGDITFIDASWQFGYDLGAHALVPFSSIAEDADIAALRLVTGTAAATSGAWDASDNGGMRDAESDEYETDSDSEESQRLRTTAAVLADLHRPSFAVAVSATRSGDIASKASAALEDKFGASRQHRIFSKLEPLAIRYGDGQPRPGVARFAFPPDPAVLRVLQPLSTRLAGVTGLKLAGNSIGDDGVLVLCRAVRGGRLRYIEVLDLAFNQLTAESCRHFARYLLAHAPPDLRGAADGDADGGADAVAAVQQDALDAGLPPFLRSGRASRDASGALGRGGGGRGYDALALSRLDEYAEDAGFDFFAPPPINDDVNSATNIVALGLAWNDLEDAGAAIMGRIFAASSFLIEVNLAHNDITPSGAEALRDGIKQCTSLVSCSLAGNRVHAPVLDAINAVLVYNERHATVQSEESVAF